MSLQRVIAGVLGGPVGLIAEKALRPPKPPALPPVPTMDDVMDRETPEARRLRRRRGQGANELLGPEGARAALPQPRQLTGE